MYHHKFEAQKVGDKLQRESDTNFTTSPPPGPQQLPAALSVWSAEEVLNLSNEVNKEH